MLIFIQINLKKIKINLKSISFYFSPWYLITKNFNNFIPSSISIITLNNLTIDLSNFGSPEDTDKKLNNLKKNADNGKNLSLDLNNLLKFKIAKLICKFILPFQVNIKHLVIKNDNYSIKIEELTFKISFFENKILLSQSNSTDAKSQSDLNNLKKDDLIFSDTYDSANANKNNSNGKNNSSNDLTITDMSLVTTLKVTNVLIDNSKIGTSNNILKFLRFNLANTVSLNENYKVKWGTLGSNLYSKGSCIDVDLINSAVHDIFKINKSNKKDTKVETDAETELEKLLKKPLKNPQASHESSNSLSSFIDSISPDDEDNHLQKGSKDLNIVSLIKKFKIQVASFHIEEFQLILFKKLSISFQALDLSLQDIKRTITPTKIPNSIFESLDSKEVIEVLTSLTAFRLNYSDPDFTFNENEPLLYLPFTTMVSYVYINELFSILNNFSSIKDIENLLDSTDIITRSLLTVSNLTIDSHINKMINLINKRNASKNEIVRNSQLEIKVEAKDDMNTNKTILKILKVLSKCRFRVQLLNCGCHITLSDDFVIALKIEEIVLDSTGFNSRESIFKKIKSSNINSILLSIRNTYIGFIEKKNLLSNTKRTADKRYQILLIDEILLSFRTNLLNSKKLINAQDMPTSKVHKDIHLIQNIELNVKTIEVLLDEINIFKKLNAIIPSLPKIVKNKENLSNLQKSAKNKEFKSFLPNFIRSITFNLKALKVVTCFNNPVKYYDSKDQTQLNNYKRGLAIHLSTISINIKNVTNKQIIMADFEFLKIFCVKNFVRSNSSINDELFFNLKHFTLTYNSLLNKLICKIPIIDMRISIEIVWSILFVMEVLGSITQHGDDKLVQVNADATGTTSKDTKKDQIIDTPLEDNHKNRSTIPFTYHINLDLMMLHVTLPSSIKLLLELSSFDLKKSSSQIPHMSFTALRFYSIHPYKEDMWTPLLILSYAVIKLNMDKNLPIDTDQHSEDSDDHEDSSTQILIDATSFRFEVPFEFVFYKVFDNLLTFFKSCKQLKYNFKNLMKSDLPKDFKNSTILPVKVHPLKVPKIRLKAKYFEFSMHDDPLEVRLASIYLIGFIEQKSRISKLTSFATLETKWKNELMEKYPNIKFKNGIPVPPEGNNNYYDSSLTLKNNETIHHNGPPLFQNNSFHSTSSSPTVERERSRTVGTTPSIHGLSGSKKQKSRLKHSNTSTEFSRNPSRLGREFQNSESEEYEHFKRDYIELLARLEISRRRLFNNFSKSWIRQYDLFQANKKAHARQTRDENGGSDPPVRDIFLNKYPVIAPSHDPKLFSLSCPDFDLTVSEPSFGLNNYPEFIHKIGKGVPLETEYTILFPVHLKLYCSRLTVQIKDYPLPLISFSPSSDGDPEAVLLKGDFVIAEQMYIPEELRWIFVPLVSQYNSKSKDENFYAFDIPRTLTNIKFFTDIKVTVKSDTPSKISWSSSCQPALSYAMNSFDVLSKPPLDKSDKIGFWDKLSLLLHNKFVFDFKNGLDLFIKSGLSPYDLTGKESGIVFRWNKNVKLELNKNNRTQQFLTVTSNSFELFKPKFEVFISDMITGAAKSYNIKYIVEKKMLKFFSSPVVWTLGFLFERNKDDSPVIEPGSVRRTTKFIDHWHVRLRNPNTFSNEKECLEWDSYKGWRSQYMHLAVSLESEGENAYNSAHLSPITFHHFFHWWHTFGSSLGLPIKEGKMFKNKFLDYRRSPKFGKTLVTLKYKLVLRPLYFSHVYRHESPSDFKDTNKVAFTGLKMATKGFSMDLHQRREPVKSPASGLVEWRLKLNQGEVDCEEVDLRVLSATFDDTSTFGLLAKSLGVNNNSSSANSVSTESHTDSDGIRSSHEISWYDFDDFIEIFQPEIKAKNNPRWSVSKLASAPRFSYFRQTQSKGVKFPFGFENSHKCLIGENHPEKTQEKLAKRREYEILEQISTLETSLDSLKSSSTSNNKITMEKISELEEQLAQLRHRHNVVQWMLSELKEGLIPEGDDYPTELENESGDMGAITKYTSSSSLSSTATSVQDLLDTSSPSSSSSFRNRFIIHSICIIWNFNLREKVFRYFKNVSERRAMVFNMSRKAVKLAEALYNSKMSDMNKNGLPDNIDQSYSFESASDIFKTLDDILHDNSNNTFIDDTYLLKCISPQVRFMSKADPDKCVLVASRDITIKTTTVSPSDYENSSDNSVEIESRCGIQLNEAFFYVLTRQNILQNSYGIFNFNNGTMWPPVLPLEACHFSCLKNELVIDKSSCGFLYVKPNKLHYTDSTKSDINSFKEIAKAFFPKIVVTATSEQYLAIYNVVMEMLEPTGKDEKSSLQRINKLIAVSDQEDFSDIDERIESLQEEIRILRRCRDYLDLRALLFHGPDDDVVLIDIELEKLAIQLNSLVSLLQKAKALKFNDSYELINLVLTTDQVIVHLLDDNYKAFVDIACRDTYYYTIQSPDGANYNQVFIKLIQVFDLHSGVKYPEIVSPLDRDTSCENQRPMVYVNWKMLDPVGGINIVEYKTIDIAPIKLEVDYFTAKQLFEFVYPNRNGKSVNTRETFENSKDGDDEGNSDEYNMFYDSYDNDNESLDLRSISTENDQASISSNNTGKHAIKRHSNPIKVSAKLSKLFGKSSSAPMYRSQSSGMSDLSFNNSVQGNNGYQEDQIHKTESDGVTQMVERSEMYQLLNRVTIKEITLSLSFSGKGALKIVNVNNLLIHLPKMEYINKTWSTRDFLLNYRKDVLKLVLKHTGSFIGNKFIKHKVPKITQPLTSIKDYDSYVNIKELTELESNTAANTGHISIIDENGKKLDRSQAEAHHHHHHHPHFDPDLLEPVLSLTNSLTRSLSNLAGSSSEAMGTIREE
ncbi:hypothetical protein B5S30_g2371 [[Candida] boidinii]|nr:hypothetical protein B5S30_g2371 [[Candida] boidinii]